MIKGDGRRYGQRATVNSQQSTVNSQQSTVNSQWAMGNGRNSSIAPSAAAFKAPSVAALTLILSLTLTLPRTALDPRDIPGRAAGGSASLGLLGAIQSERSHPDVSNQESESAERRRRRRTRSLSMQVAEGKPPGGCAPALPWSR
jgi:hypothetical protein